MSVDPINVTLSPITDDESLLVGGQREQPTPGTGSVTPDEKDPILFSDIPIPSDRLGGRTSDRSLFDKWTVKDRKTVEHILRDVEHIIRLCNRVKCSELRRHELRHRAFFSRRGWRARVREIRTKGYIGEYFRCVPVDLVELQRRFPGEDIGTERQCRNCGREYFRDDQVCRVNYIDVPK